MDRDLAARWLFDATPALRRVTNAERRVSGSLTLDEASTLAASDELAAATRDATVWVAAHVCPDPELGSRVDLMLKTCADVARTTQQAISHPAGTMDGVLDHLSNLLAIIEIHTHALDRW